MTKKKTEKQEILEDEIIEEADEEIEEVEDEKITQLENQLRRAVADYQNLEKRTEEKRQEWALTSNRSLIVKLLPILDDLFLAQKHIQDAGLNLSIQKFLDLLKEEGIEEIETKDQEFDPNAMECVSVQEVDPSADSGQMDNKVLEELRKGYIMNDVVLRPAQVIVGGKQVN